MVGKFISQEKYHLSHECLNKKVTVFFWLYLIKYRIQIKYQFMFCTVGVNHKSQFSTHAHRGKYNIHGRQSVNPWGGWVVKEETNSRDSHLVPRVYGTGTKTRVIYEIAGVFLL